MPPPPLPLPLKVALAQQHEKKQEKPRATGADHRLTASVLPLARCSSTPSQPNISAGSSGNGGGSCRAVVHERAVERSSSCIFGRSNPFETDFSVKELVGEGGFGKIYKCKSTIDGRWYAVKLEQFWFKPQAYFSPADMRETLMKEALVLARLDHENVCRYFNTWVFGSLVSVDKLRAAKKHDSDGDDSDGDSEDDRSETSQSHRTSGTSVSPSRRSEARRSSSTYSSSSDWDVHDGDDDELLRSSALAFDDDDDSVDFSDLGFDMQDAEPSLDGGSASASESSDDSAVVQPLPAANSTSSCAALPVSPPPKQPRRRLMSLESPHASVGPVCTQIDVYIQMALYEGNSLQFWLDQRKVVDATAATRIFLQIVAGLKYIHSEGLVHRDIKPANIFLTLKGSCVKIGDFGLAKNTVESSLRIPQSQYFFDTLDTGSESVSSAGDRRRPRSASGDDNDYTSATLNTCSAGVGTPMYSSPEQMRGSPECDASTDVYSLGVLLCELFCVFSTQMERVVVLTDVRKGKVPAAIATQHPDVAVLIQRMVQDDRTKRPSCAEIERSELFHRLCIETQKQKFGSASSSSSSGSLRDWHARLTPPSSPRGKSAPSHTPSTAMLTPSPSSVQIRSASHSATVALFTNASGASSKHTSEGPSSTHTVQRLLQEIAKLEDDADAVLAQLSSTIAAHASSQLTTRTATELIEKATSIQRERRTRLASALEALGGSTSRRMKGDA